MLWQIGLWANLVVAVAYVGITWAIVRPLIEHHQLRTNPLGAATAAIFFTCALHHGGHVIHMLLPYAGVERSKGLALRQSYDWEAATWDVVTSLVGIYYWTLRRTYGPLMRGAQLFEDMRTREQQALEINDGILQGLVVTKMALDLGERDTAQEALDRSIAAASAMVSDLLGHAGATSHSLTRSEPATLEDRS